MGRIDMNALSCRGKSLISQQSHTANKPSPVNRHAVESHILLKHPHLSSLPGDRSRSAKVKLDIQWMFGLGC